MKNHIFLKPLGICMLACSSSVALAKEDCDEVATFDAAAWATANAWTNATGTAKTWSDGNYAVFATGDTVTLRVEDGKLILNIQPGGLMVIFR